MKIGYIMQADAPDMSQVSGPQLHVKAVVQGLKSRGHAVRMVAIQRGQILWSDDLESWQPAQFGFSQTRLFRAFESPVRGVQRRLRLPFLRLFDSYRFSDACVAALAGHDVLYERSGVLSYGGFIASKRLGVPLILEVNGDIVAEYDQLGIRLSKSQWKIIHLLTRLTLRHVSHIVTVTKTLKKQLIAYWQADSSKITVVANGAQTELFASMESDQFIRSRFQLNGEPIIIFVGSLQPWHGVDLIIDAFGRVASIDPRPKLILVGDGPVRAELTKMASSLNLNDRVIFTGLVPHQDVAALLSSAQVAVLNPRTTAASLSQSPLKLFEYMAAGKAIVAPRITAVEQILNDRVSALLVAPDSAEALANAMGELLNDDLLRTNLGRAARQQALELHSWEGTVTELEKIACDLVNEPVAEK